MPRANIELNLPQLMGHAQVIINGIDIVQSCRSISIHASADEITTVTLDLFPAAVTGTIEGQVTLSPITERLLQRLGWTPPSVDVPAERQGGTE